MRKAQILTAAAGICGAVGLAVRRVYKITALEEGTGLPIAGAPAALLLAAAVIITAAVVILLTGGCRRWEKETDTYAQAFAIESPSVLTAMLASGALMILGGAANAAAFMIARSSGLQEVSAIRPILGIVCIAAGFGVILTASSLKKGLEARTPALLGPGFVMCVWAMSCYHDWARDPVLGNYVIPLLAVLAAMAACYLLAGFAFGKARVRAALVFSALAGALSIMALGDGLAYNDMLLHAAAAVYLLTMTLVLGQNRFSEKSITNQEDI